MSSIFSTRIKFIVGAVREDVFFSFLGLMKHQRDKVKFDLTQFESTFFVPYKLKPNVRTRIAEIVKPDKVEHLIATLEYISSRVMDSVATEEREPNRFPFFDNEFDRDWLIAEEYKEESIDQIAETDPTRLFSEPVFTAPVSGNPSKVSLIISPNCFEQDLNFGEMIRLQ